MTFEQLQDRQEKAYADSIVEQTNGRIIRTVNTRWGILYAVQGTGMAYETLEQARKGGSR